MGVCACSTRSIRAAAAYAAALGPEHETTVQVREASIAEMDKLEERKTRIERLESA